MANQSQVWLCYKTNQVEIPVNYNYDDEHLLTAYELALHPTDHSMKRQSVSPITYVKNYAEL
jgi:hypothetical protein